MVTFGVDLFVRGVCACQHELQAVRAKRKLRKRKQIFQRSDKFRGQQMALEILGEWRQVVGKVTKVLPLSHSGLMHQSIWY